MQVCLSLVFRPQMQFRCFIVRLSLRKGMPFHLRLLLKKLIVVGAMTREQLDAELQKGIDFIKAGKICSTDEVDETFAKEYGGHDMEGLIGSNE
jgi:DNA-damage-inducible protein J